MLQLCMALVILHLDYCVQYWSPLLKKYINAQEAFQRKCISLVYGLGSLREMVGLAGLASAGVEEE